MSLIPQGWASMCQTQVKQCNWVYSINASWVLQLQACLSYLWLDNKVIDGSYIDHGSGGFAINFQVHEYVSLSWDLRKYNFSF